MQESWFGIININKRSGMSSRDAVNRVQRLVRPAKVGHAGTLDPLANGVLVVCVGPATRLVPRIQDRRKVYVAEFQFGCRSNTDDIKGEIVEVENPVQPSRDQVESALSQFVGRIDQIPPQFSAVHINGQRAYKLARRGKTLDIPPKTVDVHRIEFLEYEWPKIRLEIECGSGTYIRSIARDLGDALGCGALMSALTRTRIGSWTVDDAVDPESINAGSLPALLQPATTAVEELPQYCCSVADLERFRTGRDILAVENPAEWQDCELVAVVDDSGQLVSLTEFRLGDGVLTPKQVFLDRTNGPAKSV